MTGATGLIGSHLVSALVEHGAEVHILRIPEPEPGSLLVRSRTVERVTVHTGRLEDATAVTQAVERARPSLVVHLGAQTLVGQARSDPAYTFRVNVQGTWNLLEACRSLRPGPARVAIASSDKAYGPSATLPYRETDPLGGTEPYEASKAMTDMLGRTYAAAYGLPTAIARCGNVYGAGDLNYSRIVPGTLRSLLRGERPVLRSDGTPVRDYIHVEDVVSGYLALLTKPVAPGDAFNLSSGERLRTIEVVRVIQSVVGGPAEPVYERDDGGEIQDQYLDSTKARSQLGWSPVRSMRESLPAIAAWYRELLRA